MEGEPSKRQVLHRQAREMVLKMHSYFVEQHEQQKTCINCNGATPQQQTAVACGVGIRMAQRIIQEVRTSLNETGTVLLRSPEHGHKVVRLLPYCHYNPIEMGPRLQDEDYQRELPRDIIMEPFIINLNDSDSESDDSISDELG
ncbi:hypothetical protein C0J52_09230 [Blattella germanica]|nr:hypothetical protein C0J52_09230 [Blattella germanica]